MNPSAPRTLPRREAIRWMIAAGATLSLLDLRSVGGNVVRAKGYGLDPDLLATYEPGDLWPLTLSESQRATAKALCDVILPADGVSPSASELQVVDFIDEWISAPYPEQQSHRDIVVHGLEWIEGESKVRFNLSFQHLPPARQHAICDDICYEPKTRPQLKPAAIFFAVFRNLTAAGFYTTPTGWRDIGYVGNVALEHFDGPPPEVLKRLGLI